MKAAAMRDLLARVEAATAPDREIDQDLFCELGLCPRGEDGIFDSYRAPRYTDSLDAAMSLAERVLPPSKAFPAGSPPSSGWKINLYRGMTPTDEKHASWECCIRPHAGGETWHNAPTAALAVLCALISALIARSDPSTPRDERVRPEIAP